MIHVRPDLVVVVVTGPSGAGKTTVGRALAARLGWRFEDGDDHHSPENVAKMAAGTPLNDADREPWLAVLSAAIRKWTASGEKTVLACSALKRRYRQVLTAGRGEVAFAYLDVSREELHRRIRTREGHFVPESLLTSQLADLEPPTPEEAWIIPASGTVDETVEAILTRIRQESLEIS